MERGEGRAKLWNAQSNAGIISTVCQEIVGYIQRYVNTETWAPQCLEINTP